MRGRLERLLARRLREVAKQKGLALSHVADRAGLARSYMWRLLDGSSSATLSAVQRLADALEVDPASLLIPAATVAQPIPPHPAERPTRQARHQRTKKRAAP